MSTFTEPLLFLSMAWMIDCSPVPISTDEETAITQSAYDARSDATAGQQFESVSVSKCISYFDRADHEPGDGRTERIQFYGTFPHTAQSDTYREHFSITCYHSISYGGEAVIDQSKHCGVELERYMHYHALDHEVRLRGEVSVEDATAYLDYLMTFDFGQEHQARIDQMLEQVRSVEATTRGTLLRFLAGYYHGGCATTYFETYATRDDGLVFRDVDGFTQTC